MQPCPTPRACLLRGTRCDDVEALLAGDAAHLELGELRGDPLLQRVGAEVLRHHQVRLAAGRETRQPQPQHAVQRLLADPDRRVREQQAESQPDGYRFGLGHLQLVEPEPRRVHGRQLARACIHVDGPDLTVLLGQRRREGDRPPTATEVEHRALILAPRLRSSAELFALAQPIDRAQQNLGAAVEMLGTEHAARRDDAAAPARERDLDLARAQFARRGLAEVMLTHHTSIPAPARCSFPSLPPPPSLSGPRIGEGSSAYEMF